MDWYRHEQALQEMANRLLYLFNYMPAPKVLINPRMNADGCCSQDGRIEINIKFALRGNYDELEQLMKHELVHHWMFWQRLDYKDNFNHGARFQKKAKEVGL